MGSLLDTFERIEAERHDINLFLSESKNLEELKLRSTIIKLPSYFKVIIQNGQEFEFWNGTWKPLEDIPF